MHSLFRKSKMAKTCKICNRAVEDPENHGEEVGRGSSVGQMKTPHVCSKIERELWCNSHKKTASYYSSDRITNYGELAALGEALKCEICKNLLRKPMSCKYCGTNFCKVCISNLLLVKNECPSCDHQGPPQFTKVPRNVTNLISKFRVKCKNESCTTVCEAGKALS